MKKIFALALVAMMAATAQAQVFVGGEMNLSTDKTTYDGTKLGSNTSFSVAPMIGYELDKEWAMALRIGYGHNTTGSFQFGGDNFGGSTNEFYINPFVRYKFVKKGNFFAFIDGGVRFTGLHFKGCDDDLNQFRVGLNPGIGYRIAKNVSLTASLGDLSYAYTWLGDTKNNAFNLSLTDNVSFGVQFDL